MRIPRTNRILGSSHTLGKTQQRRADSLIYNLCRELEIKLQVAYHGTLPIMKPGAAYDFAADVARQVQKKDTEATNAEGGETSSAAATHAVNLAKRSLAPLAVAAAAAALIVISRRR